MKNGIFWTTITSLTLGAACGGMEDEALTADTESEVRRAAGRSARRKCNFFQKWAMQAKWHDNLWLGAPTSGWLWQRRGSGCLRHYRNGSIYQSNPTGAQEVHGAIRTKYHRLRRNNGFLGYPTTDESTTPDGIGRYNHFQGGSIYWRPCIGAFEVHGLIRNKWASLGWERGPLGYPKSDELRTSDRVGRVSRFQHGDIYWHPSTGAHPVTGAIRLQYLDRGAEASGLGYPTGDARCGADLNATASDGDCVQTFQRGLLYSTDDRQQGRDLRGELARRGIGVRNQSSRPTCSVFAMTTLLEYQLTELCGPGYRDLSEEYLNHVANLQTGRTDDGDFFSNIAEGYDHYGIVPESRVPYASSYDFATTSFPWSTYSAGLRNLQSGLRLSGHFIKPNGPPGMTTAQMNTVLDYLDRGIPVAIGRSHSMVVVGYQRDSGYSGGGYFIFRNSYGTGVGDGGYQLQSFAHVKSTTNDAYVYEVQP